MDTVKFQSATILFYEVQAQFWKFQDSNATVWHQEHSKHLLETEKKNRIETLQYYRAKKSNHWGMQIACT